MRSLFTLLFIISQALNVSAQSPFFPYFNTEEEKWTYIDVEGKKVLDIKLTNLENLMPFSDGLAAAQEKSTKLWGYINTKGAWIIKPQYAIAQPFIDGYAIVSNPCKKNCNTSTDGLLNDHISYILDKNGKIIFTDKSQESNPSNRYSLEKNLGDGLFRIIMGYGVSDMKNVINLKGEFLCATYSVFGAGDIAYSRELKAFKCQDKYVNAAGKQVLDLSKYSYIEPYINGYAWAFYQEPSAGGEDIGWHILLDLKGKEVLKLNDNEYKAPQKIENGSFVYADAEYNSFRYNMATKKSEPYTPNEYEQLYGISLGNKELNGTKFIHAPKDEGGEIIGFLSGNGTAFYKYDR